MELRSCVVDPRAAAQGDIPPATAIEGPGARAPLDVQILVRVDADLLAALDAAAQRERIARGSFAQRVLVAAVDQDDGATANPPIRGRRGPQRARGLNLDRVLSIRVDREFCDRLDVIARRRGETRAIFVENAMRAALARLAPPASDNTFPIAR